MKKISSLILAVILIMALSTVALTSCDMSTLFSDGLSGLTGKDPDNSTGSAPDQTVVVTYDANGGTVDSASSEVESDEKFTLLVPKRTGYIFDGWFLGENQITDSDGVGLFGWDGTEDVTVVAKWTLADYTLSVAPSTEGAGTVSGAGFYAAGDSVTVTVVPYIGYEFKGWVDEMGRTVSTSTSYTFEILETKTLTAKLDVLEELEGFTFQSNEIVCEIHGVKDPTVTEISIPDCVTSIRPWAFANNIKLKKITLGNNMTKISDNLFNGCVYLETVIVPEKITQIGYSAFKGCRSLENLNLPTSINKIASSAFQGCDKLISVVGGVDYVDEWLISCRSSISGVTVRTGTVGIADFAFHKNATVSSVTFNPEIKFIGDNAFLSANELTTVTFAANTELLYLGNNTFKNCANFSTVNLPSGITKINYGTFYACESLEIIAIPDTVVEIDDYAFYGCVAIKEIAIPASVEIIHENVFAKCTGLKTVTMTAGVENGVAYGINTIGYKAFDGCTSLDGVNLPIGVVDGVVYGVTTLGGHVFSNCTSLTSISLPTCTVDGVVYGITEIPAGLYYGCSSITNVVIPDEITGVGDYAFYGCSSLSSVTFPATKIVELEGTDKVTGFTTLGMYSFAFTAIVELDIPATVSSIGLGTFADCKALETVNINFVYDNENKTKVTHTTKTIGVKAFSNCTSLKNINTNGYNYIDSVNEETGETVQTKKEHTLVSKIDSGAFMGCTSLEYIDLHRIGGSGLGNFAFAGCTKLNNLTLDQNDLKSIGESLFMDCASLSKIKIPKNVTVIGTSAFKGCTSLVEVIFPERLNQIGTMAFSDCTKLSVIKYYTIKTEDGKEVETVYNTLPVDNLSAVLDSAFENCTSLPSLVISKGVQTIGARAFANCSAMESIEISDKILLLGQDAFVGCSFLKIVDGITYLTRTNKTEVDGVETVTEYYWVLDADGTVVDVVLPENTVGIASFAFEDSLKLKSIYMPASLTVICPSAFATNEALTSIYYGGTAEDYAKVTLYAENLAIAPEKVYYYSESMPTADGNYWHFVEEDGSKFITVWTEIAEEPETPEVTE